jgi:regulation of enolase protein 1 (concanavalin A-like superfamily)
LTKQPEELVLRSRKRKTLVRGQSSIATERLEDRRLLSVSASSSVLVFNSALPGSQGGGPSHVDTLTLTNTGSSAVTIPAGGVSIVGDPNAASEKASSSPGAFSVTNLASVPSSIGPGQSINLNLQYTASQTGVMFQSAILQVQTSDSTVSVPLHGLSTNGQFGTNEPSLVQILRANDIPTVVGAGPNDSNYLNSQYPINPDASSQEVKMPRLMAAGSGPVTITPLAAFNASAEPTVRFGYYTPGDPTDTTELFTIGQNDAQTVNPTALGATSFEPGNSTFGLYATFPGISTSNGKPDTHYSESALNTLDPSHPQKFRFFPLKDANSNPVPNAYVVTAEDFNSTQFNSFVNFVGIIRNVKPAADATGAPVLGLTNPQQVPSTTQLVFNRIQNRNSLDPAGFTDIVHDTNSLVINNTGDTTLRITALTLSDTTNWQIVNPPSLPAAVAPGGSLTLTIKFIATSNPSHADNQTNDTMTTNGIPVADAGGVWSGTLTISSNDPVTASRTVQLSGYWQNTSESENEPGLQTITNRIFNYGTTISANYEPNYVNNGRTPIYYGEEVASGYWNVADPTLPVTVTQLVSYHSQFDLTVNPPNPTTATIGWYPEGNGNSVNNIFRTVTGEGQSVLPYANGGSTSVPASGSFTPSGTFGWYLDGERSDDSLNTTDINSFGRSGHAVRFYPVRDAAGNLVPNTWLVVMDYQNTQFDNFDYQDNMYVVSNMRPVTQAPAPTDVQAFNVSGGVGLAWAPASDPNLAGYNVYHATSAAGPYTKIDSSLITGTGFTDTNPGTGTVYYRVTAVDSAGESEASNASVVIGQIQQSDILTSVDINATPAGSTTIVTPGKDYNVTAGGADIGGSAADGFRFLYEQVSGDFNVKVQVSSLNEVLSNTFAGLMARQTLDAGSPMVFSGASAADGYRFNYRTTANAVGTFNKFGTVNYPNVWVRLQRQGNVFTGFYSTDGVNWTQTQQLTLALPAQLFVGIAVASHSTTQTTTAQLRGYNLTGVVTSPTPTPTPTPGAKVAADRAALKAAIQKRASDLAAARLQLQTDMKAYQQALAALHKSPGDATLQTEVANDLATVKADQANIKSVGIADTAVITALQKQLATDLAALHAAVKAANSKMAADLHAAQVQLATDQKAYHQAQAALHKSPGDATLQAAVAADLATVQQDQANIKSVRASDLAAIKALENPA